MTERTFSYRPGGWFGIVGENATVLLPGTEKARAGTLWALVDDGAGFDAVLDALVSGGLSSLPGFVLLATDDDSTRVVIRGDASATFEAAEGTVHVAGSSSSMWVERVLHDVRHLTVALPGELPAGPALTVAGGLVRLAGLETPPARPTSLPSAPSAPSAPGPSAPPPAVPPTPPPPPRLELVPDPLTDEIDLPGDEEEPADDERGFADDDTPTDGDVLGGPPSWTPPTPVPTAPPAPPVPPVPTLPPPPVPPAPAFPPPAPPAAPPPPPSWTPPTPAPPAPPVPPVPTLPPPPVPPAPAFPPPAPPAAPPPPPSWDDEATEQLTAIPEDLRHEQGIAPESEAEWERPAPVAHLSFSSGDEVDVDGLVVIGRAPDAGRFPADEEPTLVTVPSPHSEISSTHVEVRPGTGADHGHAVVTDLGSTNGTLLVQPGQRPEELRPGVPVVLESGALIDLGDGLTIRVAKL